MKQNATLVALRKALKANASAIQASQDRADQARWDRLAKGKVVTRKLESR
jgi:hypothetical protein